jgi:lipopolysaccharide biosynthesis glycosyltransferase
MSIHVALAFDQNYENPFLACAASIVNNHVPRSVEFHLIATGLHQTRKQLIKDWLLAEGFLTHFYDLTDPSINRLITFSTWTQAVYFRLYFPVLVDQNIERLIYLDTDTLVLKNLAALYSTDLRHFPVAAVYDNYVRIQPLIGLDTEGSYFNSGVLVMDLKKWREQKISEITLDYLVKNPDNIRFVDQCGLNYTLKGNWLKLPKEMNLLYSYLPHDKGLSEWKNLEASATVIHFTLQRPWHMLCKNRFRKLYHQSLCRCALKMGPVITDFSPTKIVAWLKIRMNEYYLDSRYLRLFWRAIKPKNLNLSKP